MSFDKPTNRSMDTGIEDELTRNTQGSLSAMTLTPTQACTKSA